MNSLSSVFEMKFYLMMEYDMKYIPPKKHTPHTAKQEVPFTVFWISEVILEGGWRVEFNEFSKRIYYKGVCLRNTGHFPDWARSLQILHYKLEKWTAYWKILS